MARLLIINRRANICSSDYEFAKTLFEIPVVEREKWLRDKILEGSSDFVEYNKTLRYLEKVLKWRRKKVID